MSNLTVPQRAKDNKIFTIIPNSFSRKFTKLKFKSSS